MEKIFESEYRFLSILWENEPIASPRLVELCDEKLGWKKSTTYTVIKKLSEKGIVKNENTIVTSLVTKEEVDRQESEELLQRSSKGNVPAFLAAFLKDRKLSREDVERIKEIISEAGDEE
ncbi:MAG: BlaI/MecI/CopY family transcriptional regulator [Lachnospiraceae bacterium]|nr:BlaI/MecI/CopY family transcriptional regulator [Lachnospiraceae bacterium]